ncbi:hypothetical protein [Allobaculum sp. Allo2]|uniref:hypothetical protein n=1 Tax=Allobaculum sp. Allo2 TaxID=2853432 RepID=UPI001F60A5F2|nr:hypothetical protein [Allobaculum sp. Allo2]UNT92318.1 hypothetical protein KWG61_08890 [Allobaculum sp. Allo2]
MANGRHETDRHQDILFPFFERDIPLNDRNDIGLIQNITKILFRNLHETQAPFPGGSRRFMKTSKEPEAEFGSLISK